MSEAGACATFRPAHPEGLRPPRQLRFVFRQERRLQVAWAFPTAERAGRAARLRSDRALPRRGKVPAMFWPLIGGFVAFVLVAVLLGWIMDPARRADREH